MIISGFFSFPAFAQPLLAVPAKERDRPLIPPH
jgi:hypothetical protein